MNITRTLRVEGLDAYEIDLGDGRAVRVSGLEIDSFARDPRALLSLLQERIDANPPVPK